MTEQLSWIPHDTVHHKKSSTFTLYIDGASRGNPGKAGIGVYLLRDDSVLVREGFFIGTCTNNQAEYIALLVGICRVRELTQPDDHLIIYSDSELLIRQLHSTYRVKNQLLQNLYLQAQALLHTIRYVAHHIPRDRNRIADALANEGIDMVRHLPEDIKVRCGLDKVGLCS